MTSETLSYGPFTEEAYAQLEHSAKMALIHELGHYAMTKFIVGDGKFTISLSPKLGEQATDSGTTITTNMGTPRFVVLLDKDPNLTPTQEKLISASGYAAEQLFGISKPWEIDFQSETDLAVFENQAEYLFYVNKAKELLQKHQDDLENIANSLASRIAAEGPGDYTFEEEDFKTTK